LKLEMIQLIQHIESGDLNLADSITHEFPLEDINEAMNVLENQVGDPIRVVLRV